MKVNVHGGHAKTGGGASGAVGLIRESDEDRKVKNEVIKLLAEAGHTVYDCTVDKGSQSSVLRDIVKKCNAHTVDLDVSIHFNAGASGKKDGKTTGTEVLIHSNSSKSKAQAEAICKAIAALGFKNRGVKIRPDLYVLKHTNAPALLVECCFVDDPEDVKLYDAKKMAQAIVKGITGKMVKTSKKTAGLVRITTEDLNVRAGAGVSNQVNDVVHKGEVYTIVEKKGGWGRLKSGAGWINLSYTEVI